MVTHFVTGGTGFVGSALILELLRHTPGRVVALVRPGKQAVEERLQTTLEQAARIYDQMDLLGELGRCSALAGDITQVNCGLQAPLRGRVQVWHSAASLNYEDRYLAEIRNINVDGTRHVLDLAAQLEAEVFNYISTAYVAGRTTGTIREAMLPVVETSNHYERSKVDCEALVAEARHMQVRILRPSIVVGHSKTLAATAFSGYYGFIRQMTQFRGLVDRTQKDLLQRTVVQMRLDPEPYLNLVGVDAVVHEAVALAQAGATGVFHLTHPAPPTIGATVRTIFDMLELHEPVFTMDRESFTWLDKQLDKRMDFYGSYIVGDKHFDRARTDAGLADLPRPRFAHQSVQVEALGRWYLERLLQARGALPAVR